MKKRVILPSSSTNITENHVNLMIKIFLILNCDQPLIKTEISCVHQLKLLDRQQEFKLSGIIPTHAGIREKGR